VPLGAEAPFTGQNLAVIEDRLPWNRCSCWPCKCPYNRTWSENSSHIVKRQYFLNNLGKELNLDIVNLPNTQEAKSSFIFWQRTIREGRSRYSFLRVVQIVIQIRKNRFWIDDGKHEKNALQNGESGAQKRDSLF
jgi:hypothetical protein